MIAFQASREMIDRRAIAKCWRMTSPTVNTVNVVIKNSGTRGFACAGWRWMPSRRLWGVLQRLLLTPTAACWRWPLALFCGFSCISAPAGFAGGATALIPAQHNASTLRSSFSIL
jgi:hypothetical protein